MPLTFLPVNPLRTSSGAIATLVGPLGSESAATPAPFAGGADELSSFNIVQDSLSASQAATLGVGSIFKGSIDAKEHALYFDAMSYTDRYDESTDGRKTILGTRWGVGIRVLLRVVQLSGDVTLNFGLVGAAVQLGQAKARYEIVGIGLGHGAFSTVLNLISPLGDFDYETYLSLKGPVVKGLSEYIESNISELRPQPIGVALSQPIDQISTSRSVYFAMSRIMKGQTLAVALGEADIELSTAVISDTYEEVLGQREADVEPSSDARARARSFFVY